MEDDTTARESVEAPPSDGPTPASGKPQLAENASSATSTSEVADASPPSTAVERAAALTAEDVPAPAQAELEPASAAADRPAPPRRRLKIGSERRADEPDKPTPQAQPNIAASVAEAAAHKRKDFPPPNVRAQLPPELEKELEEAFGDASLDALMEQADRASGPTAGAPDLTPEARVNATVLKIHRDDVFVSLGGQNQGVVPLHQFGETPPELGTTLELVISRHNPEDNLYELTRPGAAVDVANWDDVREGAVVEVEITGSNKGGLECKVAGIRGFMPMGQISIYRIENAEEFVGQRLACVVTEVNRDRKNLVLSHRAVMEREKAAAREKLLAELAPGQIREGTVRSLRDFGAFVDLGGVDGLVHISKLSWDRVGHPSEVLREGQPIKVRIEKMDAETGKISLSHRDLMANPWDSVERNYPVGTTASGKISRIMDFGAFVKLEPGVEGLIHVSELAHGRVWRPSDVVTEGQDVDVKILSVDRESQRIGLSLRALQAPPETKTDDKKDDEAEFIAPKDAPKAPAKKHKQLKGGLGKVSGGEQFGLKW